jgi:carbamoyl-phosphate synthase small subunit
MNEPATSSASGVAASPFAAPYNAVLAFADGTVIYGYGIGAEGTTRGEICFNTAMTGYQEVLTDPSYAGQIITFTFPHIGNVGANDEDIESGTVSATGLIVREDITAPSNWRALRDFNDWLEERGITGICGVDTRKITRAIRKNGPQNIAIRHVAHGETLDVKEVIAEAKACPNMKGLDLAKDASLADSTLRPQTLWSRTEGYSEPKEERFHVVAVDYGIKRNILRHLTTLGCRVTFVSATTSAKDILKLKPDGVFLSNGPGDPAATGKYAVPIIRELVAANLPVFGICLGHQLLGIALGGKTEKMQQGHRGANHPIKNLRTGAVEITSQNHGFTVAHGTLPATVEVTHISLFDGTIAGLRVKDKPVFAVQYHPESSPGPHDSRYLFREFIADMEKARKG